MARFPRNAKSITDFAAYTNKTWGELDGYYSMWTKRWRRVLEFIRSQHWTVQHEREDLSPGSQQQPKRPSWRSYTYANHTLAIYNDMLAALTGKGIVWVYCSLRLYGKS